MGIAVLGPLQVDDHVNGLSPRDRVVLSALVVNAREPMSTDVLADALWGNALPASWAKVVYGCVWRLRKQSGDRGHRQGAVGLPPDPGRRRARPPDVRATPRARAGGPGRERPCARDVPAGRGARPVAREGTGRPRGVGAGAGGGRTTRGSADGRRGAARRGGGARRPRAGCAGTGACPGRAGAVPGEAMGVAGHRAVPVRPATRGPRRRAAGAHDAGRGARPGSWPRARRPGAAAAPAGPGPDSWRARRGEPRLPVPGPASLRRRGRRLVLRPRGRPRGLLASTPGLGGPGRGRSLRDREVLPRLRWCGRCPDPRGHARPGGHTGCASDGLARGTEASWPPDPGGGPGRGGAHAVHRPCRTGDVLHRAGHPRGCRGWARSLAPCRPPRGPGAVRRHRPHPRGRALPPGPDA